MAFGTRRISYALGLGVLLLVGLACTALAADQRPQPWISQSPGSGPSILTVAGDYLYFVADDGITGRELWKLDQHGEVSQVADLTPGPTSSGPIGLTASGDALFFFALATHVNGSTQQVFVTLGTPNTTRRVSNFQQTVLPILTASIDDRLFFVSKGEGPARELWVSGRTARSTRRFDHTVEGARIEGLLVHAGRLYFSSTPSGTDGHYRILMIGAGESNPSELRSSTNQPVYLYGALHGVSNGNRAYFSTGGSTWWTMDREPDSIRSFVFDDESIALSAHQFALHGNQVYVQVHTPEAGKELWTSDGTSAGSRLVKDIVPGPVGSGPFWITPLTDNVVFVASDEKHGAELWRTDGTSEGTRLLKDLVLGPQSSDPYQLCLYNGIAFFSCENDQFGEELWRTDGTPEGTFMIGDFNDGPADAEPYYLTPFNGKVYFSANRAGDGEELWETDGTRSGTRLAARINPTLRRIHSADPRELTAIGDEVYFVATDRAHGREIFRTDGTADGSQIVQDLNPGPSGSHPSELFADGDTLRFQTKTDTGSVKHWRLRTTTGVLERSESETSSDDPNQLSRMLNEEEFLRSANVSSAGESVTLTSRTVFVGHSIETGSELWAIDLTTNRVSLILDILPGPASSAPRGLTRIGDHVYFRAQDPNRGSELWRTDGTAEGTGITRDNLPTPLGTTPAPIVPWQAGWATFSRGLEDGRFSIHTDSNGNLLGSDWLNATLQNDELASSETRLFFVCRHPAYGSELWCYDADVERAYLITDLR